MKSALLLVIVSSLRAACLPGCAQLYLAGSCVAGTVAPTTMGAHGSALAPHQALAPGDLDLLKTSFSKAPPTSLPPAWQVLPGSALQRVNQGLGQGSQRIQVAGSLKTTCPTYLQVHQLSPVIMFSSENSLARLISSWQATPPEDLSTRRSSS